MSGRDLLDRAVEAAVGEVALAGLTDDERTVLVHEEAEVLHVRALQVDRVAVELGGVVAVDEEQLVVAGVGRDRHVALLDAGELVAVLERHAGADVDVVGVHEGVHDLVRVDVAGRVVRQLRDDAVVELLEVHDGGLLGDHVGVVVVRGQDPEGDLRVRVVGVAERHDVVGVLHGGLEELAELVLEAFLLEELLEAGLPEDHVELAVVGVHDLDLVQLEVSVLHRTVDGVDHDVEDAVDVLHGDALDLRVVHDADEGRGVEVRDREEEGEGGLEEAEELSAHG